MTATDELRRLLDERGVEYHIDFDGSTEWESSTGDYSSGVDCGDGKLVFTGCLTPAQAIEATLGRGTCYDVGDSTRFVCSECGCSLDLSDLDGEPTMWVKDMADTPNFCPNCGREVVDG